MRNFEHENFEQKSNQDVTDKTIKTIKERQLKQDN